MTSDIDSSLQRRRKVEFPFLYSSDGRLVQVVAKLSDNPGALAQLLTVLGSKVNLIGTSSYSTEEGDAIFSGFGKILSRSDDAQSIQKLAAGSPSVRVCQVWQSANGLLVDNFHHGLQTASGEPYLMIPSSALASTFETVVRTFGTGGELILFVQGMDYANARWEVYKKILGSHPEKRFPELAAIFGALGWGVSTVSLENGTLKYVTRDCFECSVKTNHSRTCAFLRGMAVGVAQAVYGRELTCEETRCRQRGDELCEFVLTAKDGKPLA